MYIIFRWCCHCKCKMSGKDREGKSFPKKKIRLSVLFFLFLYSIVSVCIFFFDVGWVGRCVCICAYWNGTQSTKHNKKNVQAIVFKTKMKKICEENNEGREIKQVSVFLNLNLNMHVHTTMLMLLMILMLMPH